MATAANILIIILELTGLRLSARKRGWGLFVFYTQLSNIVALLSSIFFLLAAEKASWLRFTGTCMVIMTFFVSLCILVPMGAGFTTMMLRGSGLFHHTLCPVLSTISYVLWEPHASAWIVPVVLTLAYGIIMLYLNWTGKVDGPYPFFRIRQLGGLKTTAWFAVLTGVISLISLAVVLVA